MRLKKTIRYGAEANWNHFMGGVARMNGFIQEFDTPCEYGGNGDHPCPDQLFMASIAGCIVNTFSYYRELLEVETKDLKVEVSSEIHLTKAAGYRISEINIEIKVWSDVDYFELNKKCAERAKEFCHLTKSIEESIPIKTTIHMHLA
jgi:uncharacterized OsmC-like protein